METSSECSYDYVKIFDGNSKTAPVLGRFCQPTTEAIESSGNSLLVAFKTDHSQGGRGFHARYYIDCDSELEGLSGTIESPNFPDPYPHNRNCTWTITAPPGNRINATFSHFDIEDSHHRYVF